MPRFHKIGEYAHSKLVYIINKVASRDSPGNYGFTDNVVLTKGNHVQWESEAAPGGTDSRITYNTYGEFQASAYSPGMGFYFYSDQASNNGAYLSLADEGDNSSGPGFYAMNIRNGQWTTANQRNDHLGSYTFAGFDDADVTNNLVGESYQFTTFASLKGYVSNIAASKESGQLDFNVMNEGTLQTALTLIGSGTAASPVVEVPNTTIFRRSSGRYYLEEFFSKRPQKNVTIAGTWDTATTRVCNEHFQIEGDGVLDAKCLWGGWSAGIKIGATSVDNDQIIVIPHQDREGSPNYSHDSAWSATYWSTKEEVEWEAAITTSETADLANMGIWAGLKNTSGVSRGNTLLTDDDDKAFFIYASDSGLGTLSSYSNLHFVYSVDGDDYITNLGLAIAQYTTYRLRISIDSDRKVSVFINDVQYGLTHTAGTTGTTESDSTRKSSALIYDDDNPIKFMPVVGIQSLATDNEPYLYLHYEKMSRSLV